MFSSHSVCFKILLATQIALNYYQIKPHTLLKSFLTERQQQVNVGNSTSPLRTMNFGVPQGSILTPTLFSIFIDDLLSSTTFLQSHAYADNTVFYGSDSSTGILCRKAQNDINAINQWCIDNGMFINT